MSSHRRNRLARQAEIAGVLQPFLPSPEDLSDECAEPDLGDTEAQLLWLANATVRRVIFWSPTVAQSPMSYDEAAAGGLTATNELESFPQRRIELSAVWRTDAIEVSWYAEAGAAESDRDLDLSVGLEFVSPATGHVLYREPNAGPLLGANRKKSFREPQLTLKDGWALNVYLWRAATSRP